MPTTSGSRIYRDYQPSADGITIERIRAAGGILVGKTNLPEFSTWPRTVSWVREECLNPWNTSHITGGSSGGSGCAAAAGMVPLAIGTDGGGSTRLPAALNGVVGVQPGRGVVPSWGRVGNGAYSGIGPMTRDVRDAARLLTVISGPDPRDPMSDGIAHVDHEPGLDDGVAGWKIGWLESMGDFPPNPRLNEVVLRALGGLTDAGGNVTVRDDRFHGTVENFFVLNVGHSIHGGGLPGPAQEPEVARAWADPSQRELFTPYFRALLEGKLPVPSLEAWNSSLRWLNDCEQRLNAIFEVCDIVVTPTAQFTAPPCPADKWSLPWENLGEYIAQTALVNLVRYPAVSVPCGFLDGLPVGLQLMGPLGSEVRLLRTARALEVSRPWAHHHPALVLGSRT
jgi:Asp-tRNA(Asn)/Glu-tRNA(Gln) amidotransferase A subunit family amidase